MPKYYAKVEWAPEDVMDLRPEWTEEMAEAFLIRNQGQMKCRLIELGWEVIQHLICYEHYEEEYGEEVNYGK